MRIDAKLRAREILTALPLAILLSFTPGAAQPAHAGAAQPRIGRIFFSPAERRARKGIGAGAAAAAHGVAPPERFEVNGAVSSDTQGRAVWINGVPIAGSTIKKSAWTDRDGNVWFHNDALGTRLMRPGQSIDRSGRIEDLLPSGSVSRR